MSSRPNTWFRTRRHAGMLAIGALFAFLSMPTAQAQLRLPAVPNVPTEPITDTLGSVGRQLDTTINNAATQLNSAAQTTLRSAMVRNLLRSNRATLEADPNGAPMIRSQVMALNPSPDALTRLLAAGFSVVEDHTLEGLDTRVVVLSVPAGLSTRAALQRLRTLDPGGSYDFNHLYLQSGELTGRSEALGTTPLNQASHPDIKVGLIDGGIDARHPVFKDTPLHEWGASCNDKPVPSEHGTAVASLIAGNAGKFHGAAAGAKLYVADVYCGSATGGSLNSIAQALAWLAQQQVPVINISLVGPPNALLEQLVRNIIARGAIVVAAVGNDGPNAPALYPAAYPDVIGVTGVDAHSRVLIEAERGPQVDFAAPGADMAAATLNSGYAAVRGTSFAAPIVAGLLAAYLQRLDRKEAIEAVIRLAEQARDLGAKGVDKVYGIGLVGESVRIAPTQALN